MGTKGARIERILGILILMYPSGYEDFTLLDATSSSIDVDVTQRNPIHSHCNYATGCATREAIVESVAGCAIWKNPKWMDCRGWWPSRCSGGVVAVV